VSALPRSVLVADDGLYATISGDPNFVELLDDLDAMVIPFSSKPQVNEQQVGVIREVLLQAGQLTAGALLIKNPYETERYELAEFAIETFASAKYHALANVARLLGAKEVHVIETKVEVKNSKWASKLSARIPAGGGEADVSRDVTRKIEERLEGQMKFPGADPAPDQALGYLGRRNLSNDQQMRDLVEMRTGANLISGYKMTFSGTREAASNLNSALKLANAGPVKAVNIGASFSHTADSLRSVEITTKITF